MEVRHVVNFVCFGPSLGLLFHMDDLGTSFGMSRVWTCEHGYIYLLVNQHFICNIQSNWKLKYIEIVALVINTIGNKVVCALVHECYCIETMHANLWGWLQIGKWHVSLCSSFGPIYVLHILITYGMWSVWMPSIISQGTKWTICCLMHPFYKSNDTHSLLTW